VTVLVVAVSARMLATLAAADGYDVVALDRFGDVDLRAVAPGATARGAAAFAALAEDVEAGAVVYGAGLENRPDLVARLAAGRELLGTPAALLPAVRDPWALGEVVRVPETVRAAAAGDGWLRKPLRSGGGRGVRRWTGGRLRATEVLQRRVDGLPCSAVAVGDGRRAVVLGITEQLQRGYAWIGNVVRADDDELAEQLRAACEAVVARFGVRGAFGLDAVWDGRHAWVVEVNPRPTAALELFGPGTFALHVRGAREQPLDGRLPAACAKVKLVLFADRDIRAPSPERWPPELVRDVPHAGERIGRGQPVCTLVSAVAGPDEMAAEGARLLAALPEAVEARA
jgi:predicted ATP-grasp superfamily ATP-dependent carboligase